MATGDPMWTCIFCGKRHYANNSYGCDCNEWKQTNDEIFDKLIHQTNQNDKMSCHMCGGLMVRIRGRHPKNDDRIVCPCCIADRLDDIYKMADPNYGKAYQDKK